MKARFDCLKAFALLTLALGAGTVRGAVRHIDGATFDPPLVPTTNLNETASSPIYNRYIVDDATLTGINMAGILYTDVEGPTNATATVEPSDIYRPFNGTLAANTQEALTGLSLSLVFNGGTYTTFFASAVHAGADEGFFIAENDGNDDIEIFPLGSDGERIGSWSLVISNTVWGVGDLLRPHGHMISLRKTGTTSVHRYEYNGLAFKLDDFSGGSGVLDNVMGLEIVTLPGYGLDLVMAGIYRGPGVPLLAQAGRPFRIPSATFTPVYTNASGYVTNDYDLISIGGAASISGPTNAYSFDSRGASSLMYPDSGIAPSTTDEALLGLGMNGVRDIGYRDIMFAEPITNANDGFFIIEEAYYSNPNFVYPLDADRRPISTYAIAAIPCVSGWYRQERPYLMDATTKWYGAGDGKYEPWGNGNSRPGGIMMPLSAFAGGTGGLTNVYGVRILYPYANDSGLDPLVIGSYIAKECPLPVYDAEFDPMPTVTPDTDHVGGDYRHPWTLKSITSGYGRYTDLEGPASAVLATADWEYCIDDPNPPASAAESALGLDSSGLMNANNCKYYFDTIVTNGFDGGFFVIVPPDNDFTVLPLGTDSNAIAGYSIAVDRLRDLQQIMEADVGISWTRKYGNPPSATVGRSMRGTSFTLRSFTNSVGESLTNGVIGLQLTDSPSIDPMIAGIYKGPADPPALAGAPLPITGVTFTPPLLEGVTQYSNEAAVASVQSVASVPWSIKAPSDVYVLSGGSTTYYPYNAVDPDPNPGSPYDEGYTNALLGLDINGVFNVRVGDYMFDRPVRNDDDGFFIIGRYSYVARVRPLGADRTPISTYSALIDYPMYGDMGLTHDWRQKYNSTAATTGWMRGAMIRKSDFAGGTGELGLIYGIRIEDSYGEFDPAVVGEWFGPPGGTMIRIQ